MRRLAQLLALPDFRRLWLAQIGSNFGDSLTSLSLLILVQRITGSTVAIAGLLISITLPSLLFSLVSGVYVDRFDRKRMMVISDVLRAVLVLGFVFAQTLAYLPVIYVLAFLQAGIGTLFLPARSALLPAVVGEERLLEANSISQTTRIIFSVLGTGAAGVLASLSASFTVAFVIDSVTFAMSALLTSRIRTSGTPEQGAAGQMWRDMVDGLGIMWASRPLRGVLLSLAMAMLGLGAVNVLMVPFLIGDLQLSEALFGALELAQVAGMVLSGGAVAVLASKLRPSMLVSLGLVGVGLGVGLLAGVRSIGQLLVLLFFVGLSVGPTQAGVSTLSQTLVEDSMRGRVGGVLNSLISGATIVSMGAAGVAAAAVGTRGVFVAAGVLAGTSGVLGVWLFHGLSTTERLPTESV
ncbi:MAG: MFS transporter [Acidimicrobiia bacterium]